MLTLCRPLRTFARLTLGEWAVYGGWSVTRDAARERPENERERGPTLDRGEGDGYPKGYPKPR